MIARTLSAQRGLDTRDDRERYLAALNRCFPGWGGRAQWDWCFERPVAGHTADFLRIGAGGVHVAGSAVTYRPLRIAGGAGPLAAMMVGSWTLPEARGAGAFTRIIQESTEIAALRGAAVLLAFVTAANASRRRLEAAGASMMPTFYCRSGGAVGARDPLIVRELPRTPDLDLRAMPAAVPSTSFAYTADEWRGQFVDRPGDMRIVEAPDRWTAVVEQAGAFDRLHALRLEGGSWLDAVDALTARALEHGRQLFVFTASEADAAILRGRGFEIVGGFLTAIAIDARATSAWLPWVHGWHLQNGDRM